MFDAHRPQQRRAGDRRRARAIHDQLDFADFPARQFQPVDQPRRDDDRRSVLIVVKHGYVQAFFQFRFDVKAFGGFDVLQIDSAESAADHRGSFDDLVGIARIDFDVDRVDVGEAFEQNGFALHHGFGRRRSDVAQPQNRGSVRHDGDQIALCRVQIGVVRILFDFQTRRGDAGGIRQRQIPFVVQGFRRFDLDFSGAPAGVQFQRFGCQRIFIFRHVHQVFIRW